jgi:glutamate dehydrogenase/leucine dehydrogenase
MDRLLEPSPDDPDQLLESSTDDLARRLGEQPAGRAWFLRGDDGWRTSGPELEGLCRWLEHCDADDRHEAIFLAVGPRSGCLFGAFLHRTARGPGQGGLRRARYATCADFLRDGLRLSRAMTLKNALAGLWWGGGKGVIARPQQLDDEAPDFRRTLYLEYGDFVSSLRGCYVTAEDVGTRPEDVAQVFERSRFVTCIPEALGGSGNPSHDTARGVVCGMEAALSFLDLGDLEGKRVAVQGVGAVGQALIGLLLERGVAEVIAAEASTARLAELCTGRGPNARDPRLKLRGTGSADPSILAEACDVLAPCALGGVLGPATIPKLRTRIVCGSANNVLLDDDRDAADLAARGITYVPDFVVNRMGIVRCADEHLGRLQPDPLVERQLDPSYPHEPRTAVGRRPASPPTGPTPSPTSPTPSPAPAPPASSTPSPKPAGQKGTFLKKLSCYPRGDT